MSPDTPELVHLKGDDVDAFYAAIEPHIEKMSRVAGRLSGWQNRDDVLQDALLQAWRARQQFEPSRGALSAWLLAITAHQATKVTRRLGRRIASRHEAEVTGPEPSLDLRRALGCLTARERLAVDCFYFADLSVAETAAVMKCSEGTVKSTLSSARQRLRKILE